MAASKQTFSVVPMSTLDRVRRNIHVNPENVDVSESQIERQYLRTLSKERSDKWPNTLDVRQSIHSKSVCAEKHVGLAPWESDTRTHTHAERERERERENESVWMSVLPQKNSSVHPRLHARLSGMCASESSPGIRERKIQR